MHFLNEPLQQDYVQYRNEMKEAQYIEVNLLKVLKYLQGN